MNADEQRVIEFLEYSGLSTMEQIQNYTGLSRHRLREILGKLTRTGRVWFIRDRGYELAGEAITQL